MIVASGVIALVGSLVLQRTDTMAWFDLDDEATSAAGSGLRMLEAEGETPAERVVTELAGWAKPSGWKVGKPKGAVPDSFGLPCLDGPVAWHAARARTLSGDGGEGQVAVIAYPAGGGGAAFAQVREAAGRCAEDVTESGFGTESGAYRRGKTAVQVVRRGDVLAVVSASPADRMPDEGWLTELDDRLARLLGDSCIAVDAPAGDAQRNPFIDPEAFTGNVVMDPVPFPAVDLTRAEDVATDPVVPLDVTPPAVPDAGERPAPLDPPAPDLPDLPLEVALPQAPQPPQAPNLDGRSARAVADPDGPGCGWEFTSQAAPTFDEATATRAAEKARKAEVDRLVNDAAAFEQGKVNFYRAWSEHLTALTGYQTYATELAAVRTQWEVVIDARAEFVEAFERYRASQKRYDEYVVKRDAAQTEYDANLLRCLNPLEWADGQTCPAQQPAILTATPPTVEPRPTPSALAQLPEGWEPPAPVVEEPDESDEDDEE